MRAVILALAAVTPLLFVAGLIAGWPWPAFFAMAAAHALLLYATLRPNVQWLGPVVTHFSSSGNEVWLTIDDGPADDTAALLEALALRGVRVTFFVKGSLVEEDQNRAASILRAGHAIANHSYTHPSATFWCLLPRAMGEQIDRCARALEPLGPQPLFRAPVGMKNPFVHPALKRRGLVLIGWSVRTFDSIRSDPEEVVRRVVKRLEPGAILVMHQGREWSVRVIGRVVDEVMARGYTFVVPSPERFRTKR